MRFWTNVLTFCTVCGGWFALEASLIKVVRKFLHFFTLSIAALDRVGPPEPPLADDPPELFDVDVFAGAESGADVLMTDAFPRITCGLLEITTGDPARVTFVTIWGVLGVPMVAGERILPCWWVEVAIWAPGYSCGKKWRQMQIMQL